MSSPTPLSHLRHDLRTPINQIIGYSELLMEEADDAGHAAYAPDLEKIRDAARHLLNLINDNLTDDRLRLAGDVVDAGAQTVPAGSMEVFRNLPGNFPTLLAESSASFPQDRPAPVPGRILVVDDNEGNRDMLSRQLERQGHAVATAADGQAALERLRAGPFDLVLLDMMMPVLDGYGALDAIKTDPALRHLPVIMISALDELASVVRCIERGAEDFLPKPFNPTLLRARIGAGLEKKRFRDQERTWIKTIEDTQARLQAELAEAGNYVRSILPPPGLSRTIPVDWRLIPSTELGGDSFGYHWIDDDHFALYLLDVCGHGVGAALLSVAAINVLRNGALPDVDFRDPGALLTGLNEAFLMEKQNDMYFTLWYGVWQPSTRTLRYATAGHPPALLVTGSPDRSAPATVEPLKAAGMILGGMSGTTYKTFTRALPDPVRLYLVSDGTFEITRADGTLWPVADFHAFFARPVSDGESDLDRLHAHVKSLGRAGPLDDDFSIVRFTL
ncbi:serine phosphatase [Opitutaceae bacterium TAV5]|nr:serine phosphatase [Opitutaceae bacterium TAV5]